MTAPTTTTTYVAWVRFGKLARWTRIAADFPTEDAARDAIEGLLSKRRATTAGNLTADTRIEAVNALTPDILTGGLGSSGS